MGALPKPMTVEEFLRWEDRQELRHEFDGVAILAMTGATLAHSAIQINLIASLSSRLRGRACRPHGGDLKIKTNVGFRYPDASVTCSPGDPGSTFAPDPVVIFEILSNSTASLDLGVKRLEYQAIPSVQRYVLLHQKQRAATVFFRSDDAADGWAFEELAVEDVLEMPEIGVSIPIDEFYQDVALTSRGA